MASNRDDPLTFINPSSSPITVSSAEGDSFLLEPASQIGSASGSFQNEGLLSGGDGTSDAEFGFSRPDFRQSPLAGTVQLYDRHVFLCYKHPQVWPPRIEAAEFDRLPRLLSAALMARKSEMKKQVCESVFSVLRFSIFDDLNCVYGVSVDCMLFGVVSEVWVKEISGD
ncbi:hypothetical protein CK203_012006 [Vitis vinifera]|uniref:Uncharacterized protein n=1 Tax=Vitis vinifera TaxID=29760 RepID=A0A438K0I0_VITVI|nr:hypothetical protein CK203_012006 [Vitis vinifera]